MKVEEIKTIAVIGAGFMGPGLAQVFANKGYSVNIMDIKPEMLPKAESSIRSNLLQMVKSFLKVTLNQYCKEYI
jgi:3-hydroxybutyryl-CoA dehydrogenase